MGQMAIKVGVSREHLSQVLHGNLKASPELLLALERETNGAIDKSKYLPHIWPPAKDPAA